MGTTAGGFPYPEPSDPIAAGADAIKALAEHAEAMRAKLFTGVPIGTSGSTPAVVINSVAIPAQTRAGKLLIAYTGRIQRSVISDTVAVVLNMPSAIAQYQLRPTEPDTITYVALSGSGNLAAGVAVTVTVTAERTAGTGTITSTTGTNSALSVLWVPN